MFRIYCSPLLLVVTLTLWGCGGSSHPNSSPAATIQSTKVSGAVVDAFVVNSTVTAYEVSSAGVVGACVPASSGSGCATATTDSNGNYTVNVGGYSGALLLKSTGGTYTDTVTGQTVSIPSSLVLSSFVPAVSPGSGTVTAQITGLTTIAANLALGQMAPPQSLSATAAATSANTQLQGLFGVQNLTGTALLNLATPSCGSAAGVNQANFDASLLLAGIAQLAAQYGVSAADLTNALITDGSSNGESFTGLLAGSAQILIGSSGVSLSQVEGNSLTVSLLAAIKTFVSSAANACKAAQSMAQQQALSIRTSSAVQNCNSDYYCYRANATYSGPTGVYLGMRLTLACTGNQYASTTSGAPTIPALLSCRRMRLRP